MSYEVEPSRYVFIRFDTGKIVFETTMTSGNNLYDASNKVDVRDVRWLIGFGANVKWKNGYCEKPLQAAGSKGHTKVGDILISKGADVNASDNSRKAPLHSAARYGYAQVADLLLSKGADENFTDNRSRTALDEVRLGSGNNLPFIKLLVERGANVRSNSIGCTVPAYAKYFRNNVNTFPQLDTKLASETVLLEAAKRGDFEQVSRLIDRGVDINWKNHYDGDEAARWGRTQVIDLLISKGAAVNIFTESGDTPLYTAAFWGDLPIVKRLVEAGVDISSRRHSGITPYHDARLRNEHEIAQYLKDVLKRKVIV